jgi:hypothetical protein
MAEKISRRAALRSISAIGIGVPMSAIVWLIDVTSSQRRIQICRRDGFKANVFGRRA